MKSYEEPNMRVIRLHNDDVVVTYDGPIGGTAPTSCPDPSQCSVFPGGKNQQGDPAATLDPESMVY